MEFVENREDAVVDAVGCSCEDVGDCGVALVGCGILAHESDCGD